MDAECSTLAININASSAAVRRKKTFENQHRTPEHQLQQISLPTASQNDSRRDDIKCFAILSIFSRCLRRPPSSGEDAGVSTPLSSS